MNRKAFKLQCPKCPNKMGSLARHCNACGAKMPESRDPAVIAERESKDREGREVFGKVCGKRYHKMIAALSAIDCRQAEIYPMRGHCPECGEKVL